MITPIESSSVPIICEPSPVVNVLSCTPLPNTQPGLGSHPDELEEDVLLDELELLVEDVLLEEVELLVEEDVLLDEVELLVEEVLLEEVELLVEEDVLLEEVELLVEEDVLLEEVELVVEEVLLDEVELVVEVSSDSAEVASCPVEQKASPILTSKEEVMKNKNFFT